jgi:hypothetical protein
MAGSTPLFVVCESASCSPQTARRELASRVGREVARCESG